MMSYQQKKCVSALNVVFTSWSSYQMRRSFLFQFLSVAPTDSIKFSCANSPKCTFRKNGEKDHFREYTSFVKQISDD